MKLDPRERELILNFLSNADFFRIYDASNEQIIQMYLSKNGLSLSKEGCVMSDQLKNTYLYFDFDEYVIDGLFTINFFNKNDCILEVFNSNSNAKEITNELLSIEK